MMRKQAFHSLISVGVHVLVLILVPAGSIVCCFAWLPLDSGVTVCHVNTSLLVLSSDWMFQTFWAAQWTCSVAKNYDSGIHPCQGTKVLDNNIDIENTKQ